MEQPTEFVNPRKRVAQDLDCPGSEEASAKRACSEVSSESPHLTLLEELYDLEGEDEVEASEAPLESSTQEDLVAEMMKSLEKVIESGESRGEGEPSTSSPGVPILAETLPALEFTWNSEDIGGISADVEKANFNGELKCEEDFKEDAQIRELLQASDDELGLPLSSSSSDLDESSFHEEWLLVNEGSVPANISWLDASYHQFDEGPSALSKEMFEPLLLF